MMDFTLYWFMFPTSILIATLAMLSGIGGAARFMPLFILVFPLLGPEYQLSGPVAAIAVALLTQTFGFLSGFSGYYYKNLIDFVLSRTFLILAVPAAAIGAILSHIVDQALIRGAYGILMLLLAVVLLRRDDEAIVDDNTGEENPITPSVPIAAQRRIISRDGRVYRYKMYNALRVPTCLGGFHTGMLSVGIGEVVMPQLVKAGKVPAPVAAATSIMVVIVTAFTASLIHIATMIQAGGVKAVPWNLVVYTIPGVIIGGQIGPGLQGRIDSNTMEKTIGLLFILIGIAMLWTLFA